jgi:hypothetical protein
MDVLPKEKNVFQCISWVLIPHNGKNKPESCTSHKLAKRRRLRIALASHFNSSFARGQGTLLMLDGVEWVLTWYS